MFIYILTEYGDLCSALENANFFIETLFSLPPPRSNPFVHYTIPLQSSSRQLLRIQYSIV